MLFAADGKLLYTGGITGGRGHEGDNLVRETVQKLIYQQSVTDHELPVFGCPLLDPNQTCLSDACDQTQCCSPPNKTQNP